MRRPRRGARSGPVARSSSHLLLGSVQVRTRRLPRTPAQAAEVRDFIDSTQDMAYYSWCSQNDRGYRNLGVDGEEPRGEYLDGNRGLANSRRISLGRTGGPDGARQSPLLFHCDPLPLLAYYRRRQCQGLSLLLSSFFRCAAYRALGGFKGETRGYTFRT